MNAIDIVIGFGTGLLATILFTIGPFMQKAGINQLNQQFPGEEAFALATLFKNRQWVLGALLYILAAIPFIVSLTIIGITVLQPLTAFGYLLLVYVAIKKLGEKVTPAAIIGVAVLAAMPLLLSFSDVSNTQANMLDPAAIWMIMIFTIAISAVSIVLAIADKLAKHKWHSSLIWAIFSGLTNALSTIWTQAIFTFLQSGGYDFFLDLGILPERFMAADPYVIGAFVSLFPCIAFTVISFLSMQVGFRRGNATLVYPVSQSLNILGSVTGGILLFAQQVGNPAFYIIAICFTMLGTMLVGKFQAIVITLPRETMAGT